MRRTILALAVGILLTSLLLSFLSVFLLHNVNRDHEGGLGEAFLGLCVESVLFVLVVVGPTWLLTFVGLHLLKSTAYFPNPRFGLWLGVGVTVFQYAGELGAMVFAPSLTDTFRLAYLIGAVIVCPAVLLAQAKAQQLRSARTDIPKSIEANRM